MKKYEFTEETTKMRETILHRIIAVRDFDDVKKGDLGGFIESERNLSHKGNAWVYDNAMAYDNAQIDDNAKIFNNAWHATMQKFVTTLGYTIMQ